MDARLLSLQSVLPPVGGRPIGPLQPPLDDLFLQGLEKSPLASDKGGEEAKLMKAARAFEGHFVYMLFKEMQKTTPKGSLFGGAPGGGGELYEHLFHQALADKIASGPKGFGLTSFLMRSLQKRGGKTDPTMSPQAGGEGLPLQKGKGFPMERAGQPFKKEGLPPSPTLNLSV